MIKKIAIICLAFTSVGCLDAKTKEKPGKPYSIKIKNDTEESTFSVDIAFENNNYESQSFNLAPKEERTFKKIPSNAPIKESGIRVKIVSGRGLNETAAFKPRKKAKKIDIELETDDQGKIVFDKEFIMFFQ